MNKKRRGRRPNYPVAFKTKLVLESQVSGVTVPMVSKRHGVPTGRIYAWRADERFQGEGSNPTCFTSVEVRDTLNDDPMSQLRPEVRIEITLENGRRLSVSGDVGAGYVVELTRGLGA